MLGIFSASFMILFVRSIKNKMLIVCQPGILKRIFVHWNDGATELIKKGMWVGGRWAGEIVPVHYNSLKDFKVVLKLVGPLGWVQI